MTNPLLSNGRRPADSRTRRLRAALALAACALLAGCAASTTGNCESPYASSPQFKGCGFQNPPNPAALPTAPAWKIWPRFIFGTKTGTEPVDRIPVRPLTVAQLDALDPEANHVVRIGHSTSLLKLRGKYWLIDPMFSERASPVQWFGPKRFSALPIALAELPPIEGVVLSHNHFDHLDAASIGYLATRVQRFFVPLGVGPLLREFGVPADRITESDWWQSAVQGAVEVTAVPTQHFSGRGLTDRDKALWAGWVFASGGQRIYYSGDGGAASNHKQIGERFGGFDLALIENGAYDSNWPSVHMTPEQSVQAFEEVRGKVLMPVHNSTFDLAFHPWQEPMARIAKLAADRRIELATPELGEVVTIGRPRSNALWWQGLR